MEHKIDPRHRFAGLHDAIDAVEPAHERGVEGLPEAQRDAGAKIAHHWRIAQILNEVTDPLLIAQGDRLALQRLSGPRRHAELRTPRQHQVREPAEFVVSPRARPVSRPLQRDGDCEMPVGRRIACDLATQQREGIVGASHRKQMHAVLLVRPDVRIARRLQCVGVGQRGGR